MGFWSFDTRKGGGLKLYLYISSKNDLNLLIVFQWRWCTISIAKRGVLIFLLCVLVQLYYHDLYFEQQDHLLQLCPFLCWVWSYISANHALFFNILYPTGPQIVPVPFISISNQSSTFSVSLTRFLVLNPHRIHLLAMLYLALFKEPAL